jgi:hypothetical protein
LTFFFAFIEFFATFVVKIKKMKKSFENWYFVVLDEDQDAKSKPYQALKADELHQIGRILHHLKTLANQYIF